MSIPPRFRAHHSAWKKTLLPLLALLAGVSGLQAQQQNLIANPGFERSIRSFSLWSGISSSGHLESPTNEADILAQAGGVTASRMPVSISAGDLNGDGLPDIAAMDGFGYLKVYFNSGSKTDSKFTAPEYASLFLNPLPRMRPVNRQVANRYGTQGTQRIHLADVMKSGKLDLLVGTYGGTLHFIPNTGSPTRPEFRNPARPEEALIKSGARIWANVLAPHAVDWNKDGRLDLLVGEGSYSANSIHVLVGKKMGPPAFEDSDRHVLAWGMGLEQLSPCVVDWNNDGHPDLLVTERGGRVALYLNPGTPWKPGNHLPFHSLVTVDGAPPVGLPPGTDTAKPDPLDFFKATNLLSTGGISTISSADFNGDGLFDLVFGKRSGRIAIALNKGQSGQPKFGQPEDVKATAQADPIFTPSSWSISVGELRGNFFAYAGAVKADANPANPPAEGSTSLIVGYAPPKYSFMPAPAYPRPVGRDAGNAIHSPNYFEVSQALGTTMQVGKTYLLTFKVLGSQVTDATATLQFRGLKQLGEARIVRGERESVKKELNNAEETRKISESFSPSANWSEIRKEFAIKFEDKNLNTLEKTTGAEIRISFLLAPGTGQIALDDFKLVEKQ